MFQRFSTIVIGSRFLALGPQSVVYRTQRKFSSKPDDSDVEESTFDTDEPREFTMAKCTILGRLGTDPRMVTSKKGQDFVALSVATNRGNMTDWHQVLTFQKNTMNYIMNNMIVGDRVFVTGTLLPGKQDQHSAVVIESINKLQTGKKGREIEEELKSGPVGEPS